MKQDKITVEAFVHYKQGDDFSNYLEEYSPAKALEMWGKNFIDSGQKLVKASEILAKVNNEISADADTHHIGFYGVPREIAEELFKLGLFYQDHFEKEHEDCSGCEECSDEEKN